MTLTDLSSLLALVALGVPASISIRWLLAPPFGRSRTAPALIVACCACAVGSHVLQLAGMWATGGVLRLAGTVVFALLALELLNRAPRQSA